MKKTIFEGIGTAIITPLDENGVNYDQFGRMIDWQIEEGINALIVCGTTGEGSTLTDEEHKRTIAITTRPHRTDLSRCITSMLTLVPLL